MTTAHRLMAPPPAPRARARAAPPPRRRCGAAAARSGHRDLAHHASRARRHDDHAVAQHHRLLDVVGDEHHGPRLGGQHVRQPGLHLGARDRVERGERLVQGQHRLAGQQRAQERDALAHPARQLGRARALEARQAEALQPGPPPPRARGSRPMPRARSASAALSSALSHGSSRSRWGISAAGARVTVPASGACRPQMSSSSVVLPQPLGPTTATISPGAARIETPASAGTAPVREANVLLTSSTRTPPVPRCAAAPESWSLDHLLLPSRALPHRFKGSAPGARGAGALSQPAYPPAPLVSTLRAMLPPPTAWARQALSPVR